LGENGFERKATMSYRLLLGALALICAINVCTGTPIQFQVPDEQGGTETGAADTEEPTVTLPPTATQTPWLSPMVGLILEPGHIVEHAATSETPYSYFTYFPKSAEKRQEIILGVWPHGGGRSSDDYADHQAEAERAVKRLISFSERYRIPIISVAVPRVKGLYITTLVPGTFSTQEEMHLRPDLKVIDAVWSGYIPQIESMGYEVDERVFMMGFSSVSVFTLRFTIFHPDRVKAAWLGASATGPIPASEYEGTTINYPVGIADIEALTGKPFDLEAYRQVPHMIVVGEKDTDPKNDTTLFRECYTAAESSFIRSNFGETKPERAEFFYQYLVSMGMPATFTLYKDEGHNLREYMLEEAFDFFVSTSDGVLDSP
jgi:hypothetical protein